MARAAWAIFDTVKRRPNYILGVGSISVKINSMRLFERWVSGLLLPGALAFGQVKIARDGDRIIVDVKGKPFTALYITGAETTKPYFHPVRAASRNHCDPALSDGIGRRRTAQ